MRTIFNALVKELGQEEGRSIFEWYCATYHVTITDEAPASVKHEVLGYEPVIPLHYGNNPLYRHQQECNPYV